MRDEKSRLADRKVRGKRSAVGMTALLTAGVALVAALTPQLAYAAGTPTTAGARSYPDGSTSVASASAADAAGPSSAGQRRRPGTQQAGKIQIKGVDVSTLKKNTDKGAVYRNSSGAQVDPLQLLRSTGVNYARLKVWVNPADGYNNRARVLEMAKRTSAQGMKLLVDFHYSDSWADPGKQTKPAAWSKYSVAQLRDAVYNHTYDVLSGLKAQGTPADMAQVGNEINGGMLWPEGKYDQWANLASFLKAGASAVKAASPGTRVVLHLAEGGNNSQHRWWFDNAVSYGVPFDVIAVSHYLYWHGNAASLRGNLTDLASRYNKDVMVAETAYGFTTAADDAEPNIFNASLASAGGFPATSQGQSDALRAVFDAVAAVPNGRGLGVFYWEPTWTAVAGAGWDPTQPSSGNGWENQALFDYNDRALPAMSVFSRY